ncbi:hypothetical protein OUO82_002958, partial [Enterococcus faecalis]|nr:hypothetical protein [Enterococcus faecalis]
IVEMKKFFLGMLMIYSLIYCMGLKKVFAIETDQSLYKVNLQVTTNGEENNIGGELSTKNNILEGKDGDTIILIPKPRPGYIFNGYKSFRTDDGASTDGLLDINNNMFELSDKIGNVTIYADFIKEIEDPNVYFKDNFNQVSDLSRFTYSDDVRLDDGSILLSPKNKFSYFDYNLLSDAIEESSSIGYSVGFSLGQTGEIKEYNTIKINFRNNDTVNYFLELTGKKAILKKTINQNNMILSETNFKLDEAIHTYRINVINHSISIEADNRVILNFHDVESNSFDSTKPIFKIEENSLYRSILL